MEKWRPTENAISYGITCYLNIILVTNDVDQGLTGTKSEESEVTGFRFQKEKAGAATVVSIPEQLQLSLPRMKLKTN